MTINAIICTRSREDISETTDKLLAFFNKCRIHSYLISGATSIFSAYEGAYRQIAPKPDDIMIFCHDDIEINQPPDTFLHTLVTSLNSNEVGFVGPAGTTCLSENAVWWDQILWQQGKHKGKVHHIDPQGKIYCTSYGPPDDVVVLDGLFLAAKPKVIEDVGLKKPEYFEGVWDFYDLHYTSQAFLKGYTNKVIDLNILHNSRGELVGREGWEANRASFIENNNLPLQIID